eukprot:TRINITY_DN2629_c0_g1_i2.p1 TRINITY_DN2629_c0_g1~~TRINITY_DN2629_c0_g1_i2.p1  ORF type:complete len:290 (+),score=34.90 TRINITY_DN2629_c0_g1_i2:209-1078(+)
MNNIFGNGVVTTQPAQPVINDELFSREVFFVLSNENDVEATIKKCGGRVVQKLFKEVTRVVAAKFNALEKRFKEAKERNVSFVKHSWIEESMRQNKIVAVDGHESLEERAKKAKHTNNPRVDSAVVGRRDGDRMGEDVGDARASNFLLIQGNSGLQESNSQRDLELKNRFDSIELQLDSLRNQYAQNTLYSPTTPLSTTSSLNSSSPTLVSRTPTQLTASPISDQQKRAVARLCLRQWLNSPPPPAAPFDFKAAYNLLFKELFDQKKFITTFYVWTIIFGKERQTGEKT